MVKITPNARQSGSRQLRWLSSCSQGWSLLRAPGITPHLGAHVPKSALGLCQLDRTEVAWGRERKADGISGTEGKQEMFLVGKRLSKPMVVGGNLKKCQTNNVKRGRIKKAGMRLEMKFHLRPADCRREENILVCDFKRARRETSYQSAHAQFSTVSRSARYAPGGGQLLIMLTAVYQNPLNSSWGQDLQLFADETFSYFSRITNG